MMARMSLGRARWAVPLFIFLNVWGLTTRGKFSVAGDEPHYLIICESLISDHDLDVGNNYTNGGGRWFAVKDLEAGPHARPNARGAIWSVHDIGLPIVLLPAYAVLTRLADRAPEGLLARFRMTRGHFGYGLISVTMAGAVALGLAWFLAGAARVAPPRAAISVTLVLGLAPPVFSHAFLVFPETLALVVTCAVVWLLCMETKELTPARVAAVIAALGAMPWLHRKFSFLAFGLLVVVVQRHLPWFTQAGQRVLVVLAALFLLPQIAFHAWTWVFWGHLGGPQMLDSLPFTPDKWQAGSLGLLFDRERGLFSYAPIYLVAPACFALTWRVSRWLLVPVLALYLPMTVYVDWAAGFCPAARYLVPLMPLLALPVLRALAYRPVRIVAIALLAFQILIGIAIWQHPRVLWQKQLGTNQALERIPVLGTGYERALPSIATGDSVVGGWICLAVLVGLTTAIVLSKTLRTEDTEVTEDTDQLWKDR